MREDLRIYLLVLAILATFGFTVLSRSNLNECNNRHYGFGKLNQGISHKKPNIAPNSADYVIYGIRSGLYSFGEGGLDMNLSKMNMSVCPVNGNVSEKTNLKKEGDQ